jgi:hypothetical protein
MALRRILLLTWRTLVWILLILLGSRLALLRVAVRLLLRLSGWGLVVALGRLLLAWVARLRRAALLPIGRLW